MECSCGGVISTSGETLTYQEALAMYPQQMRNIQECETVYIRCGVCPGCGRRPVCVHPGKPIQPKSIFKFIKKRT